MPAPTLVPLPPSETTDTTARTVAAPPTPFYMIATGFMLAGMILVGLLLLLLVWVVGLHTAAIILVVVVVIWLIFRAVRRYHYRPPKYQLPE